MNTHSRKLLVIITEAALEERITRDAMRLGAHGYTAVDVRGAGGGGKRAGDWEADRNVQIEIICDDAVAAAIAEHVQRTYFEHYAVSLFVSDVHVLRPEKF
ncbi:MAG: transcriptional regulator [Betaproteobacteria bacterium]|nr:transcriptional regulator [Betaproteobacteria bacterium]